MAVAQGRDRDAMFHPTSPCASSGRRAPGRARSDVALVVFLLAFGVLPTRAEAHVTVTSMTSAGDTYFGPGPRGARGDGKKLLVSNQCTTVVRFDLAEIPVDAIVRSARLRLYLVGIKRKVDSIGVSIHQVNGTWDERDTVAPAIDSASEDNRTVYSRQR